MSEKKASEKKQKNDGKLHKAYHRVYRHVQRFLVKSRKDNVPALAGQSAFFILLSIIPFIIFFFLIVAMIFGEPKTDLAEQAVAETDSSFLTSLSVFLQKFLLQVYESRSNTLIITAVMTLWSAGKGMYIITDGISRIYQIPVKYVWLFRRIFAMGYTFVMLVMLMITVAILTLSAAIESYLNSATEGLPLVTQILFGLRYVFTTVIMTLFLTIALKLYLRRRVDDKKYAKFRVLIPGAFFTAVAWSVLTWGVEFYMKHFSASSVYGSLCAVLIIMLWVYFVMYLLLYGVQINYIYREQFYNFSLRETLSKLKKKKKEKKEKKAEASAEQTN